MRSHHGSVRVTKRVTELLLQSMCQFAARGAVARVWLSWSIRLPSTIVLFLIIIAKYCRIINELGGQWPLCNALVNSLRHFTGFAAAEVDRHHGHTQFGH